ncbi:hypothetical protein A1Q1_03817 [Trichosporon asahii var. asahii CBS 2479]|uniref:Uncharacterized protein n=1 Tax=Trichosporon asahii var. asahii (strain ATCC 90039 / CBS 2479 / JCM 2466 / KCTC 7840 / NBRC 103889/ NCYC 2677 / UAMH 7654) TaxID=1186058 RepID=J5SSS6_TRIAS|nr:hypothetical protein A1Q1_03817 [Trichosporon asahii var. asahii CBS 2479]EJT47346.1 hypothetical protein A1Q1_03817 [Trichosporon asahii var. asahii CBS 2479]
MADINEIAKQRDHSMLTWEQQQIQGAGPIVQKLAVSRIERVVLRSRSSSRLPLGNGCGNIVDSAERNAGGNASSRRSDGAKAALPAHTLAAQPSGSLPTGQTSTGAMAAGLASASCACARCAELLGNAK